MSSSGIHSATRRSSELPALPLGIIGGSGICSFPEARELKRLRVPTDYGDASDEVIIAEHQGVAFAFLPRHGSNHALPPHKVPYRANLEALKKLGVRQVVGLSIGGSLRENIKPGDVVVLDQFVNLTWGRDEFIREDGSFLHLPMATPYCDTVRTALQESFHSSGKTIHPAGTVAVIQGPRFSTIAESRWLMKNGWDVVNMTQYPECYFARELGMCYAAAIAITDYDVGIHSSLNMSSRNMGRVLEVFRGNVLAMKNAALELVANAKTLHCSCATEVHLPFY